VKWIGELKGLLLIDTIGILVILLQMVELSFLYLALGRLLLGVVLGLSTSIVPVFLNSISPPMISGKIGSLNQLFQVSGVTFAFLAGYLIDDEDPKDEWRWRIFLAIPIIPFLLRIIILQFFYPFNTVEYMI
jgi:MFS family permease